MKTQPTNAAPISVEIDLDGEHRCSPCNWRPAQAGSPVRGACDARNHIEMTTLSSGGELGSG